MKRKDFTPSEAVAIGRLIEEQHRVKIEAQIPAQRAKAARIRHGSSILKEDAADLPRLGLTNQVAAVAVGMSPSSYDRAKQVVSAALKSAVETAKRMREWESLFAAVDELIRRRRA